jgi:UDP-perosamine 4-acetyltransferase
VTRVVGLGAGGHAKVVVHILARDDRWQIVALLDPDPALQGRTVAGVPVPGGDDLLDELVTDGVTHAFVGRGSTGDAAPRRALYELLRRKGLTPADAVHPDAVVATSAAVGPGVTVMAAAVINPDARLGENVIVNTGAIVEHDCVLGDHVHIAPGAVLGGEVQVGSLAHVGLGARVREGVTIGEGAVVGAGAVVVADVPARSVVVGVPAKPLGRNRG